MGAAELTTMLSRSAQGLYWMSRYLERAEYVCRMLAVQFEALEDRTVDEIDRNWRRIYAVLSTSPMSGGLTGNFDDENFMLTDTYTLADEMTFEQLNPDSLYSCIRAARENARQVRHVIGAQLWTRLNTALLEMNNSNMQSIWNNEPEGFFINYNDAIRTLSGIVDSTMYRDHGWNFLHLGRYVERIQFVSALLCAQLEVFPSDSKYSDLDWSSLLSICDAQIGYRRKHSPLAYKPRKVLQFLICDKAVSHSIQYSRDRLVQHLDEVTSENLAPRMGKIRRLTGAIDQNLSCDWETVLCDDSAAAEALRAMLTPGRELSDAIEAVFFDYQLEIATAT